MADKVQCGHNGCKSIVRVLKLQRHLVFEHKLPLSRALAISKEKAT